jgi:hypothetical protein
METYSTDGADYRSWVRTRIHVAVRIRAAIRIRVPITCPVLHGHRSTGSPVRTGVPRGIAAEEVVTV